MSTVSYAFGSLCTVGHHFHRNYYDTTFTTVMQWPDYRPDLKLTRDIPYLALQSGLQTSHCEHLENGPHYNGAILYLSYIWLTKLCLKLVSVPSYRQSRLLINIQWRFGTVYWYKNKFEVAMASLMKQFEIRKINLVKFRL